MGAFRMMECCIGRTALQIFIIDWWRKASSSTQKDELRKISG